ncbi:MAG: LamG domain-containing protein [Fuerstia sp.]|nr:LamG domain-containing protein [Fuerstiella sp.]
MIRLVTCFLFVAFFAVRVDGQTNSATRDILTDALHFHAPFDGDANAKVSAGKGLIMTADSMERKSLVPGIQRSDVTVARGEGRFGDCLRFAGRAKEVICFAGTEMHYADKDWSGSVSLWMRLDPDKDLLPGYCDPLQITQHAWNNGAFFVDFDKDLPRDFRLGVFSDLKHWNPKDIPWEQWPVEKRPMVTVKHPPFSRSDWTHVVFTFDNVNSSSESPSVASLYVNGNLQGAIREPLVYKWDLSKVAIMLGIEYIGDLDDLMIFRRAITPEEVAFLFQSSVSL